MATIYYSEGKAGLRGEYGEIITGPIFDTINSFYGESFHVGYIGRHPFIIRDSDGGIIDLFKIGEQDSKSSIERVMNWVLPGLQLFYRDTDTPLDVANTFNIGDVVRTGFFIDVSPYAGRPMHRFRYIIASSHAASLVMPGDRYPLHVLHYNSYLKVMDIYERGGVTQIFLLHIPAKAIFSPWLGSNLLTISFNEEQTVVDIARKSLDVKLELPPRELLEEDEWLERTAWHIGVNKDGHLFSLFPQLIGPHDITVMGEAIRKMSNDTDDINLILEDMSSSIFMNTLQDRIRGSFIGGAAGDALGYPVEGLKDFKIIKEVFGEDGITKLTPPWSVDGEKYDKALISDDTQMTLFTANGLLNAIHQKGDMKYGICEAYLEWYLIQAGKKSRKFKDCWIANIPELNKRRGPGKTCLSSLWSIYRGHDPINDSNGCGGVMRVAPIPLYAVVNNRMSITDAARLAGEAAEITHQHPLGFIPAALVAHIIYRLVLDETSNRVIFESYIHEGMDAMEELFPQYPSDVKYMGELCDKAIILANNSRPDLENIESIGKGFTGEEALAIALYCADRHFDNFERALIAAVNHAGDSDSTGAITGNILGAAVGYDAIPQKFKDSLELHDVILHMADDIYRGKVTKM